MIFLRSLGTTLIVYDRSKSEVRDDERFSDTINTTISGGWGWG